MATVFEEFTKHSKLLTISFSTSIIEGYADVVELADTPDLGSVLYVILLLIMVFAVFIDED